MTPGQVKKFMEHLIKAHTVLQHLSAKMIRYREREIDIKETLSAPMDQHRFSYANTCKDLSSNGQSMRRIIYSSRTIRQSQKNKEIKCRVLFFCFT
jgi:hypothetical protein